MLKHLQINNYVLIDDLEVIFNSGFSVLTGETGAGKSIILGALGLILGNRAESNILRDDSRKCIIEGVFRNSDIVPKQFFTENDLDYSDEIFLRREILPSGKSRAFVNDTPVNLKLLGEIGNLLVNIHSQHQTLQLSNSVFQQEVIDHYSGNSDLLKDYLTVYNEYTKAKKDLEALRNEIAEAARDEDYLRFQMNELSSVELNKDSFTEMEERARILEHSEEIIAGIAEAQQILNDDENSIFTYLIKLKHIIMKIEKFLPAESKILDRLVSINIELEDISSELVDVTPDEDFDATDLQNLLDSIDAVYTLLKKYKFTDVEELSMLKSEISKQLSNIENQDHNISEAEKAVDDLKRKLKDIALHLHKKRNTGAKKFENEVTDMIKQLGMKHAGFEVYITKSDEFLPTGMDIIKFMFNANKGVAPGEIGKIASGGELSRLMLAIKSLINQKQMLPTVIFDEIDSGVSGDIAGKVGKIMKNMSVDHQVIAITHLPQIASKADHHYKVLKIDGDSSTTSTIQLLNNNERVDELSIMLSAEKVTETARKVAREMLEE
jgi:DNA repair protein RecN (Recombination protein N)